MAMTIRQLSMKDYASKLRRLMVQRLKAVEAGNLDFNVPTFIWGAPGIGKSMIIKSLCKETWVSAKDKKANPLFDEQELNRLRPWDASNWNWFNDTEMTEFKKNPDGWVLMDVRLSQVDPVEIKGAPFYDLKNEKAGFIRFSSILPAPDFGWPVFLLLDELPLAPDMVQSAGYQLINDRKVGDYRLPERCVVLAAGNQEEFGGVHFQMSPALENRFDHIGLDIDYEGFVKYIAKPEHSYDETMVAFLQYSQQQDKEALYKIKDMAGKGNFPTFRSWEKALSKVKYGEKEYDAVADSVGQGLATKFEGFKDITKDIPDAKTLVEKKMYFEEVALQLVASQKVGNQLLNKETLDKLTEEKTFEYFQYFINMHAPKDKSDRRDELTILFLVNVKDQLESLDKIDRGFQKALKSGKVKMEKNDEGDDIIDLYGMIFSRWSCLSDLD